MNLQLQAYLERIDYSGDITPNIDNLRAIHRAHMMTVPFENLDIHVGRKIVLDEGKLFYKIVNERRGGFCFEQNGLFSMMLRQMGYDVIRLGAEVRGGDGTYSIPMGHMTLLVTLDDQRWLADVGFGDSFTEPLAIDDPDPQVIDGRSFKIEHDGEIGFYSRLNPEGEWGIQYRFSFEAHELSDYDSACHYMQTSPETHFTQKRICSKVTPDGRISLSDLRLIERVGEERIERDLADEDEFTTLLWEQFGIDLTPAMKTKK